MTEAEPNPYRHLIALAAGIVALIVFLTFTSGVIGYLVSIVVAGATVFVGHRALRDRGRFLLAAILGLVLSYFVLITSVGLLVVRLTRLG
ncbi:hypothetical protein [Microbacterium sp. NPDC087868]|uniref:hypothetical protein n=1 Tax=Microbacterium sp. NPDC087868 TaxID=3364195 RepID=UPI00384FCEB0